jgi:hypothetical protein
MPEMTVHITPLTSSELLLWLSLLSILTAIIGIFLLPQNGPMKIALHRPRLILFIESAGLIFAVLYAAFILGALNF